MSTVIKVPIAYLESEIYGGIEALIYTDFVKVVDKGTLIRIRRRLEAAEGVIERELSKRG